ncbi:acyl carrier protein [Kordiimonas sp.]|uniref:acyl carrier protein n=1 Tax=Kordiimonas sp. TaxID=1970157 RepID=UPI003A8EC1BA
MKLEAYIEELLELMERDEPIDASMRIEDLSEWDSMARISFISFLDAEFGIQVSTDRLAQCITVADLIALASDKLES